MFKSQVLPREPSSRQAVAFDIHIERGLPGTNQEPSTEEGTCWHSIFHDFAIAPSFPIPPRGNDRMRGVELPFTLMSLLTRVEYPIPHGDGFVLKGPWSALIPQMVPRELLDPDRTYPSQRYAKRTSDMSNLSLKDMRQDRVPRTPIQWHLEQTSNKSGLSLQNVSFPGKSFVDFDNSIIEKVVSENNRHFLGMYDSATMDFGTASSSDQSIHQTLQQHNVKVKCSWSLGWQRQISISAGVSVLGFVSFGSSTSFKPRLPHSVVKKLQAEPILLEVVDRASEELTVLYDTQKKLAWLLPEICVILQLMQHWAASNGVAIPPIKSMPSDPTKRADACGVYVKGLSEDSKQIFKRFCSYFRQMKEDIHFKHQGQRRLYHRNSESHLSGVDFVRLATPRGTEPFRVSLLDAKIDVNNGGGWVEMLGANWRQELQHAKNPDKHTRGLKVLAVFCRDLSPAPIQHRTTSCHVWSPAPCEQDYLVTTVGCMQRLAANYRAERGKLSPEHWWQLGQKAPFDFDACRRGEVSGSCNRLQDVTKNRPSDNDLATVFGILNDRSLTGGAIIFGSEFWVPRDRRNEPCRHVSPRNTGGGSLVGILWWVWVVITSWLKSTVPAIAGNTQPLLIWQRFRH